MMDFALATVPFVMKVVVAVWAFIGIVLILLVLIQKGRGGGLSSAFGGLSNSLLGTKTGDFLTWVTISLVAVWLLLSVVAAKWFKPQASEFLQSRPATSAPAAVPIQPETPLAEQPAPAQAPVAAQPNTPAN
jgi:preprotein translocase subunit SecG